jgi:hypothetical protein
LDNNPIPWWGNLFLLFFILAWLVRAIILPYIVSQRTQRTFGYGLILPEERATLSHREKQLLTLTKIFGYGGFLIFFSTVVYLFKYTIGF